MRFVRTQILPARERLFNSPINKRLLQRKSFGLPLFPHLPIVRRAAGVSFPWAMLPASELKLAASATAGKFSSADRRKITFGRAM